jgi:hypothetical protein
MTVEVGTPGLHLSASQISLFTDCERKWVFRKTVPAEEQRFAGSDATDLGTLLHTLMGAWWSGAPWRAAWLDAVAEYLGEHVSEVAHKITRGKVVHLDKGWAAPKFALRALPIMEAWEAVHGTSPAKDPDRAWATTSLVALELPFDLPIPGVPDARVRGFIDGVVSTPVDKVRVHDRIRLLEFKSMGRWGRENMVPFDPQLHLYLWAVKQLLPNIDGAVFEAISTYDYKEGPASRRFKRLELPYQEEAIEASITNVAKVARRGLDLLQNPDLAIRNVGSACTYCDHRRRCLTPWEIQ